MHRIFLTKSALFVLVIDVGDVPRQFDASVAKERALFWLSLVRSYAPTAPILLRWRRSNPIRRNLAITKAEQDLQKAAR